MRPRIDAITLGVADLERALAFYRALGFESPGIIGTEFPGDDVNPDGTVAMFELGRGIILAVWPRTELAKDAQVPVGPARSGEFAIGHFVADRDEVDEVLRQAAEAGASITDEPHERAWGIYSGYFRDPDGHLWEVLWNPEMTVPAS